MCSSSFPCYSCFNLFIAKHSQGFFVGFKLTSFQLRKSQQFSKFCVYYLPYMTFLQLLHFARITSTEKTSLSTIYLKGLKCRIYNKLFEKEKGKHYFLFIFQSLIFFRTSSLAFRVRLYYCL